MKFKSAIQVTEKISQAIFDLPIVMSIWKLKEGYRYIIDFDRESGEQKAMRLDIGGYGRLPYPAFFIYPTEWVCQTEDGEYYILTDEQYKKIKE